MMLPGKAAPVCGSPGTARQGGRNCSERKWQGDHPVRQIKGRKAVGKKSPFNSVGVGTIRFGQSVSDFAIPRSLPAKSLVSSS